MGLRRKRRRWCLCARRPEAHKPIGDVPCRPLLTGHDSATWLKLPAGRGTAGRRKTGWNCWVAPANRFRFWCGLLELATPCRSAELLPRSAGHGGNGKKWNDSMSFNLRRFLRRSPPAALRDYFNVSVIAVAEAVDWEAQPSALVRAVSAAIEELGPSERDLITADFEQVDKLCNEIGQVALQTIAAADRDLLGQLHSAEGNEARGIRVLLHDRKLFDHALALALTNGLLNGRSWSAFVVRDAAAPRFDPEALATLERGVSEIFVRLDGSGRRLKIDPFYQPVLAGDGSTGNRSIHYCIYAEGLPESHLEFQGTEPSRQTRRLVHEGAVSYDPERQTVDVITKGGKGVRTKIAQCFARDILNINGRIEPVAGRRFTLNRLKRFHEFPADAADGIKTVKVFLLRLGSQSSRNGRISIETDPADRTDLHSSCSEWFGDADPLQRFEWQVIQAKLRIVFQPEQGRTHEKRVTIDLRAPNSSNLKEQIRHHQLVSRKYLARWGLVIESEV
jgi:hypothetical protein